MNVAGFVVLSIISFMFFNIVATNTIAALFFGWTTFKSGSFIVLYAFMWMLICFTFCLLVFGCFFDVSAALFVGLSGTVAWLIYRIKNNQFIYSALRVRAVKARRFVQLEDCGWKGKALNKFFENDKKFKRIMKEKYPEIYINVVENNMLYTFMGKYLKEADEKNSILTKKYLEMDFEFKKLSYKHKEYILELLEKMGIKFQ